MEIQAATCFLFSFIAFVVGIIFLVLSTDKEITHKEIIIHYVIFITGWAFWLTGVGFFIVGIKYLGRCL